MDSATLAALHGSIAKWRGIVAGTATDEGILNCPLCQLFTWLVDDRGECAGCPVRDATGSDNCIGSPYENYCETNSIADAQAELDFLISLLPPGEETEAHQA